MIEVSEALPKPTQSVFDASKLMHTARENLEKGFEPILLLEDDDYDAATTTELLEKFMPQSFKVTRVKYLKEAIVLVRKMDFKIALLDMGLPDSSGLMAVREVIQANKHIPVVVLTGSEDHELALEAMRMGAQDFLPKSQLNDKALERLVVYSIHRKSTEGQESSKAYADLLTGTINRTQLHERWSRIIERSIRAKTQIGVLSIDVVNFDTVNMRYGFGAGDALLVHVVKELKSSLYKTDLIARLGDDDFVAVLENIDSIDDLLKIRDRVSCLLKDSFDYDGQTVHYSVRVGCTLADPKNNDTLVVAIKRADDEMYLNTPQFRSA